MPSHSRPITFGVFTSLSRAGWDEWVAACRAAEELGFANIWVPDHLSFGGVPRFETWTALAALAVHTRRIGIGPLVMGNTYRHPAVLANMATTLDHVARGRLTLGIGAGWHAGEHRTYGIPLPPPRERLEMLDEAAGLIKRLLAEPRVSFAGRHYRLEDAACEPKPYQGRRLPLLIGGAGKRTLRVVARHADSWNDEVGPAELAQKLAVLRQYCREGGRDPDEIEVTVIFRSEREVAASFDAMLRGGHVILETARRWLIEDGVPAAELDERLRQVAQARALPEDEVRAVDRLNEYVALGATHFIVMQSSPFDPGGMERFLTRVAAKVVA